MAYVTLLVMIAAFAAAIVACVALLRVFSEARKARRNFRETVEGLAIRTHHAAQADRELARGSSDVAEASRMLAQQATEVQDTLALERKLRKAIRSVPPPPPPVSRPRDRDSAPETEASL